MIDKKKVWILLLVTLISLTCVSALNFGQFFSGYKVTQHSGNETVYWDIDIQKNQICFNPKFLGSKVVDEFVCDEEWISLDSCPKNHTEKITYYLPNTIPILNKGNSLIGNIVGNLNTYCTPIINPTIFDFFKLGYDSIIIEGDASYNATVSNITQFVGGARIQSNDTEIDKDFWADNLVLLMHLNNETLTDTSPDYNKDNSTSAYDYSTGQNNGTWSGGQDADSGWECSTKKLGDCALKFDEVDDYLDLGLPLGANSQGTKTFSMWVNPIADADAQYFLSNFDADPSGFAILLNTDGDIGLSWDGSNNDVRSSPISDATWTHLVTIFESGATGGKIYLNGVLNVEGNLGAEATETNKIKISGRWATANSGSENEYKGYIDEFAIFNRSLTAGEVLQLYNETYHSKAYLRFDNINLGTNDTVNISIDGCTTNGLSNISIEFDTLGKYNISTGANDCNLTDYDLSGVGDITDLSMYLYLYSNATKTSSPFIFGNITLDAWISGAAPTPTAVGGAITVGLNQKREGVVVYAPPTITTIINYTQKNVNSSDYWDDLDTPADISVLDLSDFLAQLNTNRTGGEILLNSAGIVFNDGDSGIEEGADDRIDFIISDAIQMFMGGAYIQPNVNFYPSGNNAWRLGLPTRRWRDFYTSNIDDEIGSPFHVLNNLTIDGSVKTSQLFANPNNAGTTDSKGDSLIVYEAGSFRVTAGMSGNGLYLQSTGGGNNIAGIRFYTGQSTATEEMRLSRDGGLCIGSTYTPLEPPQDGLIVSGDVGIGTSTPDSKLDVHGNINATGNITSENVFLPTYISSHTNDTITVGSSGLFYNITFDHEEDEFKERITHNFDDGTNITFTIEDDGIYEISYTLTFQDSAPSPNAHIVSRVIKNNVELNGFTREDDSTKQNADFSIDHTDLVSLSAGDTIQLQFTSDDTTVSLQAHLTYGTHSNTGHINIKKLYRQPQ